MRLFFATDLHGSALCYRKFLAARQFYGADILVLGGDLTGKGIVPIRVHGNNAEYTLYGKHFQCTGGEEIESARSVIENVGFYATYLEDGDDRSFQDEKELATEFENRIGEQIQSWEKAAREAGHVIYVIPGNDDVRFLDRALESCKHLVNCDRKIIELPHGWSLAGFGGSNATPWNTYREFTEEEILLHLGELMAKASEPARTLWNVHVPPIGIGLDICEAIDERYRVITRLGQPEMRSVGSTAVDHLVRKWQPAVGLFGHVHESRGWQRVGRTLCINPGSEYYVGTLNGCLIDVDADEVTSFQLTTG